MPAILETAIDGSRQERLLVTFASVTEDFRRKVLDWLKRQYSEFVYKVRWRTAKYRNVLVIELRRSELAVAMTVVKEAVRRRALFK